MSLTSHSRLHGSLVRNIARIGQSFFSSSSSSSPGLHYEELVFERAEQNESESVSVVLHGLLGTGRNLRTFVNMLFNGLVSDETCCSTKHRVLLMDLRHHGKSNQIFDPSGPDTIENAAQDVIHTVEKANPGVGVERIIGHSLGGKVSLEVARQLDTPCQVWTLDSFPFSFDESSKRNALGVLKVLETIAGIVQPLESRAELYEILENHGFSKGLQQWLGSNLVGNDDEGYVWNFHIPGVFNMYESYGKTDYSDFLAKPPDQCRVEIIRALESKGWDEESIEKLQYLSSNSRGMTRVHELENAGHWLHAENPSGLAELMLPHMKHSCDSYN
ncbi:hypothetical protein M9434_006145 [Picochlorum sp. BPE23]|nr:hypothetical protein M9434_006145 [Picochlorum sp. BPE23]KAI8108811.1 hypothetical protein M9435_005228 [Picochlorum sp. BPE23]